ncbi:MAG: glycoside hydrolase family 3 C-terminal domain-containing protein, partial [Chloroflexota bacterium]
HAQKYLLTDVLKGEMGFQGFLVTDWEAIDQTDDDFYSAVVKCINAGIDMNMVPFKYHHYIETLTQAVEKGDVPLSRIDDAVRRILRVKMMMGVFETPFCDTPLEVIRSDAHISLAREAVIKSQVCLKNNNALPISKKENAGLLVAGEHAHNIGLQCGGWTIEWMGGSGAITAGTTILEGIQNHAGSDLEVIYEPEGKFEGIKVKTGLVVVGEEPYAEGMGDRADLHLPKEQVEMIRRMRAHCDKLIVLLLSGRPVVVSDWIDEVDGFVAGWLPGSEGDGVAEVLFGSEPFSGELRYVWPRSMEQIPLGSRPDEDAQFLPIH